MSPTIFLVFFALLQPLSCAPAGTPVGKKEAEKPAAIQNDKVEKSKSLNRVEDTKEVEKAAPVQNDKLEKSKSLNRVEESQEQLPEALANLTAAAVSNPFMDSLKSNKENLKTHGLKVFMDIMDQIPENKRNFISKGMRGIANKVLHKEISASQQAQHDKEELSLRTSDVNRTEKRVRVISDLHIGGCWGAHKDTQDLLMKLLEEMATPNATAGPPITHLVLLGDTFDWWLVPLGDVTPDPQTLFKNMDSYGYNVPKVIQLIKDISTHTKVYVVRGNHDDALTHKLARVAFGGTDQIQFMEDGFELDGVWFEHGSVIDMYSNSPSLPDGTKKKGFAYFVTRAAAEPNGRYCKHQHMQSVLKRNRGMEKFVDYVRERVKYMGRGPFGMKPNKNIQNWWLKAQYGSPEHFVPTHLRWTLEQANPEVFATAKHDEYDKIPVTGMNKDGTDFDFDSNSTLYTIGDAIRDHGNDMQRMVDELGGDMTQTRLISSGLESHHEWAERSRTHMVLVTGHTHNPYIKRIFRDNPLRSVNDAVVYANSGSFSFDTFQRLHSSYIDIHFAEPTPDQKTTLGLAKGAWLPTAVKYYEYPEWDPRQVEMVPPPNKAPRGFDDYLHVSKEMKIDKEQHIMF